MSAVKRKRIRVLVVDDSPFVCKAITRMLQTDPNITVVGHAANGKEALWKISILNPDLITLDIQMPVMDGIETLRHIMAKFPRPVLMLSSLTKAGAEITLKALELGAFDFVNKSQVTNMDMHQLKDELVSKVKVGAEITNGKTTVRPLADELVEKAKASSKVQVPSLTSQRYYLDEHFQWTFDQTLSRRYEALVIGASTGGPITLQNILMALPENFPLAVVVAQHMPPGFTSHFAERLNGTCPMEIREAAPGDFMRPGLTLIAPAGKQTRLRREKGRVKIVITENRKKELHAPSINILFDSMAESYGARQIAVILTGMGKDGAQGMSRIFEVGGTTVAQDEKSCVVYGMPQAAIMEKAVEVILEPHRIAPFVCERSGGRSTFKTSDTVN